METARLVDRLLDVIEHDIAPKTRLGVARGNKLFGAAILRKSDLSVLVAETNNEIENPLWHGEMHALKKLYELDRATLPPPEDCLFLATHEPCSLCLSAITWSGYDNFYFLFSHEDSRDSFAIPHDIRILKEVFSVPPTNPVPEDEDRPLYNRKNAFWEGHDITRMIASLDRDHKEDLLGRLDDINALYRDLSSMYQQSKGSAGIPLA